MTDEPPHVVELGRAVALLGDVDALVAAAPSRRSFYEALALRERVVDDAIGAWAGAGTVQLEAWLARWTR